MVIFLLDHVAVGVAALGGVLACRGKGIDLFGVVTLALVTALGGGTLREAVLGVGPSPWVSDTRFLVTPSVVGLVAFALLGRFHVPRRTFLVADAGAMALFTVAGVARGLACGVHASAAIVLGVMTGVAGGALRDVLLGEIPLIFRREIHLYATAALCGSSSYVLLSRALPAPLATVVAVGIILALRLASIRWKFSLPPLKVRADENGI